VCSKRRSLKSARVPWTPQEMEALYTGVARYPPGAPDMIGRRYDWHAIRNDPELRDRFHESRSGIDLKVRRW
jgi:hypothetical protein